MALTVDLIVEALASLGGRAHLSDITARVRQLATTPLPVSTEAIIRARLQERASDTQSYKPGAPDLFFSVYGVEARKGWWGLRSDPLSISDPDGFQDSAEVDLEAEEGRATLHIHLRRERSRLLIERFKASLVRLKCEVCDFDFEERYGELGHGFIEAHHTIPVAELPEGARTKIAELIAVCSNCHRMLHRNGLLDWRKLKQALIDQSRLIDLDRSMSQKVDV